ncbi:MAG: hypothetical protein BWK80_52490, partial [Desulfobacteraceae bacterium IS3]
MSPPGNALDFDGVDDYVSANSSFSTPPSSITHEAWIYPTALGTVREITCYSNSGALTVSVEFRLYPNGELEFGQAQPALWQWARSTGYSVILNAWNHVAAVKSGSNVTLYINGIAVGWGTITNSPNSIDQLNIGRRRYDGSDDYKFQGKIDEVRIWNTARTQAEIQTNMNKTLVGNEAGLVAYYNFDQGTVCGNNTGLTTLSDLTSVNNTGTLTNFTLTGGCTSNWTNSGWCYGCPVVSTWAVSSITASSASVAGTLVYAGASSVTASGVCYATTANPTAPCTTGGLPASLTGLTSGTTYYVRAYATNSSGTSYGNDVVFTTSAGTLCDTVTEIPKTECESLVDLYNSTNGPGWTNKTGWNVTNTPCSWYSVSCGSGHVTTLNLNTNQLSGTIPDFNLPNLTYLNLNTNQLSGTIPNFNLPSLTELRLYNNQLSGTIPNFNMPSLTILDLSGNYQLSGIIPNFNMPNLTHLFLGSNQLSGTIPNFNMPNLTYLYLSSNQLSGTIPNFNMPKLTRLSLNNNQLSGTIPNFNIPNLTQLYLGANQLTGTIPNFNMPNLTGLSLRQNQLSGTIPNLNFAGMTSIMLEQNCGLTAYDAAQTTVLNSKDSTWQTLNTSCPNYTVNFVASPSSGGTVNVSSQTVASGGQTSSVTATPTTGYAFTDWRDQNGNFITTSPTLPAQTITTDMTYTAYFSSTSGNTYTWTGYETGTPTDWLKAGNWTPLWLLTARLSTDNAVIPPSIANMPILASLATLNSVKIDGSLVINSGGTLKANTVFVNGTLTDRGLISIPSSAKLIISPSGKLNLLNGSIEIHPSDIPPDSGLVNQGKIEFNTGGIYPSPVSPSVPCTFTNVGQILVIGTGANYLSNCDVTNGTAGKLDVIKGSTLTIYEKDFTNSGTVRGGGTIVLDPTPSTTPLSFINKGLINPKIPSAVSGPLTIRGNFTQDAAGTLQLDFRTSADYDYLNIEGSASLDGTIVFPSPLPTGTFDVVRATGDIIAAATLRLPSAAGYTVTGEIVTGTPNVYRIKVIQGSGYTWSGLTSDNWTEAGNWVQGAVPALPTDAVIIPAGCPNYPHVNSDVHIGGITIEQNASLTIHTGFSFNIHGAGTNSGTVNLLGGNVILAENAVFTNNGDLIFFTPSGATSKFADAPASDGKLINNGMIINRTNSGVLDVSEFEQIPASPSKGISLESGTMRLASGETVSNLYTFGTSYIAGNDTLIFGSDNLATYPVIVLRNSLHIGVPLRWVSGVVEKASDVTEQISMTLHIGAEIGSSAFKKLYGMDISIPIGSTVTLKDGEFYLGNKANFKIDGGILSVEGKMLFYNYDADAALTGTVVNNGTIRGTGILSFAPNTSDPKPAVAFSNNGRLEPGLSPGLLTFDMGNSVYDHSSGTLNIEINNSTAGSGYDRLHVTGNMKLGGILNVIAPSAYVPHDGDIFDILTLSGSLTGQFASVNLQPISGFHWEPISYASSVRLTLRQNTSSMLTIAVDPADSGVVSGGGITCPAVCDKTVDSTAASSISLSASENPGYVFDHWEISNTAAGTDPVSLIVNFPANSMITQAVKAVFRSIQQNRITVSVSPSGSGWVSGSGFSCGGGCATGTTCSDVCQKDFDPSVTPSVTLTASANTGYEFDYWKVNDIVQTPPSLSLPVSTSSPSTVIAVFKAIQQNIGVSVSISPSGGGSVSG